MVILFLLSVIPWSADKVEIIKTADESIVHLIGNVVLEDEETHITCDEARLNETEDYVVLLQNVKIVDENGEIKSDFAIYYFDAKKGILRGEVSLSTDNEVITADSLHYDGIEELVEMYSDVKIEDKKNNLFVYGERGWYDLTEDVGYLADNPELEVVRQDKDPIKIQAREFQLYTNNNIFYGYDSVVAVIDSITAYCDTFWYDLKNDSGSMAKPYIVENENVLKGMTGQFRMKEQNIESFRVQPGWSRYYTEEGSENVVEGGEILIVFRDGKASKIIVDGNPKGILTLKRKL